MIGLTSRTTSPSSVTSSRSTPWVAGWCGPDVERQQLAAVLADRRGSLGERDALLPLAVVGGQAAVGGRVTRTTAAPWPRCA